MIEGLMLFTPVAVIVIDLYLLPKSGACKKCPAGLSLPSLISLLDFIISVFFIPH